MKRNYGIGLIVFAVFAIPVGFTEAQTTANGPYYATPSWDQTLPSSTRFIVLANMNSDAVLDRETGLVWEKAPSGAARTWHDARSFCANKSTGGRKGWRLPSLPEMTSLLDPTTSNPALPAGHPFVVPTNVHGDVRPWTASTDADFDGQAWFVDISATGFADLATKTNSIMPFPPPIPTIFDILTAWCVRGGMNAAHY